MVKDDSDLLGITEGANPLKVVVPELMTQAIGQSTPISGVNNRITVTLESSVSLFATHAASISISRLNGCTLNPGPRTLQP